MTKAQMQEKRLNDVNNLIYAISKRGRQFFNTKDFVAYIEIKSGRFYFVDDYSHKKIYMWNERRFSSGFSHGGTLKDLLVALKEFIQTGNQLNYIVRRTYGYKNVWGYPEKECIEIENYAKSLGIVI